MIADMPLTREELVDLLAECERDRAALIAALEDAEFLMRKAGQLAGPMQDSFNRSSADARATLAQVKGG